MTHTERDEIQAKVISLVHEIGEHQAEITRLQINLEKEQERCDHDSILPRVPIGQCPVCQKKYLTVEEEEEVFGD